MIIQINFYYFEIFTGIQENQAQPRFECDLNNYACRMNLVKYDKLYTFELTSVVLFT